MAKVRLKVSFTLLLRLLLDVRVSVNLRTVNFSYPFVEALEDS